MARVQANSGDCYESIYITIRRDNYPILYQRKLEEMVEEGNYSTIEDAEKNNPIITIELELYYDKGYGLYGVETGAVESGAESLCSPYTAEPMLEYKEE